MHTYLSRQVIASLLMTVMVFTFVLLLGNALKEILPLLVSGQLKFGVVARAVGLLVPFVWVFALPMGMLTATLLIFGRFSADQELTAVRASGISLLSLVTPILLLSLVLCGLSALVNMEVGPRCRVAYKAMLANLQAEFTAAQLPEDRFIKDFANCVLYVRKNRNGNLEDVMILMLKGQTNLERTVFAPRGKLEVNRTNQMLNVNLYDAKVVSEGEGSPVGSFEVLPYEFNLNPQRRSGGALEIDDMTFTQLWDELRDVERRFTLPVSVKELTPEQRWARNEWERRRKSMLSQVVFQIHRQVAFSFACFGFTLVGIPLGIRVHRRETNIGIALALVLVAVYYSFILVGQALDSRPEWVPHLLVWVPNFLFQSAGAVLLWRANRGG